MGQPHPNDGSQVCFAMRALLAPNGSLELQCYVLLGDTADAAPYVSAIGGGVGRVAATLFQHSCYPLSGFPAWPASQLQYKRPDFWSIAVVLPLCGTRSGCTILSASFEDHVRGTGDSADQSNVHILWLALVVSVHQVHVGPLPFTIGLLVVPLRSSLIEVAGDFKDIRLDACQDTCYSIVPPLSPSPFAAVDGVVVVITKGLIAHCCF